MIIITGITITVLFAYLLFNHSVCNLFCLDISVRCFKTKCNLVYCSYKTNYSAFKTSYYTSNLLYSYQLCNHIGFLAICQSLDVSTIVYNKLSSEPAQLSPTLARPAGTSTLCGHHTGITPRRFTT